MEQKTVFVCMQKDKSEKMNGLDLKKIVSDFFGPCFINISCWIDNETHYNTVVVEIPFILDLKSALMIGELKATKDSDFEITQIYTK